MHKIFKKRDLVDFVLHEAAVMDISMLPTLEKLATPLGVLQNFHLEGAKLVQSFRDVPASGGDEASSSPSLESIFALHVATCRDALTNVKCQLCIDILWGTWAGHFDTEIDDLAAKELSGSQQTFRWHVYLKDSTKELGNKYRALLAVCTGPINSEPLAGNSQLPHAMGSTELGADEKATANKYRELLLTLRRKTVNFYPLPEIGGSSGADFTVMQMQKVWETLRLGHSWNRKKNDCRAFIVSGDLFGPNVSKTATGVSLCDQITVDSERLKRVIDFITSKRAKDDVVLLFDGRSRANRRVMETYEEQVGATGANMSTECWLMYTVPSKVKDPRVPGRQASFHTNNKETLICSMPKAKRGATKVVTRCDFNVCGELSTSSTTYSGIQMRRYSELPRMSVGIKAAVLGLGDGASGALVGGKRMQKNIEVHGHPFSHFETKPIGLWQRIFEHFGVTHVVDFSPGSGAQGIGASGAVEYDGVALNRTHCDWLNSTCDRCVVYMAGKDKTYTAKLSPDAEFVEKVASCFSGTLVEAARLLEPNDNEAIVDEESSDDGDVD